MDNSENKYEKKNPFSVPDGYFDHLEEQVMSRISGQEQPRKTPLFHMVKPYIGLAALFVIALVVVQVVLPLVVDPNKMLKRAENGVVMVKETIVTEPEAEDLNDSFNPTSDEIIEYLVSEVDDYELLLAEVY